jgi:hypothetical protein
MNTIHHKVALYIGIACCTFVLLYISISQLLSSAFFLSNDRVNILFYSEVPVYFSFDKNGEVHYATSFQSEGRVAVPGGYGTYRLGGIGKLVLIEKNPDLLNKSFSRITGSMLNYYFYPHKNAVYYGVKEGIHLPSWIDIFFADSNANIFDRFYVLFQFIGKRNTDFQEIKIKRIQSGDEILLSDATFAEQYLGYFYQKKLRKENKTVQILYQSSYTAAINISRIIDGEGMRVVDIDINSKLKAKSPKAQCIVTENTKNSFSRTALKIASFFHCDLLRGKGRVSDIVIELGSIEKVWE